MRRRLMEGIEFPANPFVALADFLFVLLLIMILAVLHQSVSSSRLIERMAVAQLQEQLLAQCSDSPKGCSAEPVLTQAYANRQFAQTYADGDLQRFQFVGSLLYAPQQTGVASAHARDVLAAVGRILRSRQGPDDDAEGGAFKRIIVEGNADRSEGNDEQLLELSLQRAKAVVGVLKQSGLNPAVIEASGRGCWNPGRATSGFSASYGQSMLNRRVDIVITYSGSRSLSYLKRPHQRPHIAECHRE